MQIFDRITLDGTRRRTADGYLVAQAKAARSGVQIYAGREVGKPDVESVRVYRPAEEVFAEASLASYPHKPLTNDHPAEPVTSANYRDLAIGHIGEAVTRDGDYVRLELMITDAAAIAAIEEGKRELSAGYEATLDFTAGETPDGEAYDARQSAIRINHVAIVEIGRAGPEARIADGGTTMTTKTLTIDGAQHEVPAAVADAFVKLRGLLDEAKAGLEAKAGEIAALKARPPVADAAAIEAAADERNAVIADAQRIVGTFDTKGKSTAQIRRDAVTAKLGEAAVQGMSDAAIAGAFATILAGLASSPAQVDDGGSRVQAGDSWGKVLERNGLLRVA